MVPVLRFAGFRGEWEERNLAESCERIMDGTHFSPKSSSGPYLYITSKNIRMGYMEMETATYISREDHDTIYKRCPVRQYDILLTKDGANTGNACINKLDFAFSLLSSVAVLRPNASTDYGYLFQVIAGDIGQKVIKEAMSGQAITRITLEKICAFKFNFPPLPEQIKIADFLSAVDEKLQALKQKKAALEVYKKGVMQQLFSRELRFKEVDGEDFPDWEERTLGEVAEFSKGKGISKADIVMDGKTPCIRYGELYTVYKETIAQVVSKTNIQSDGLVFSIANDVIIPSSGETAIDIATASCVLHSGIALGGDLNIIRTKMNGVFLSYYLNTAKKRGIANMAQGSSVVHLYASQLENLEMEIPSIGEQTKIADFLSGIDEKIQSIAEQITQLEVWKKGLLQKMFV